MEPCSEPFSTWEQLKAKEFPGCAQGKTVRYFISTGFFVYVFFGLTAGQLPLLGASVSQRHGALMPSLLHTKMFTKLEEN